MDKPAKILVIEDNEDILFMLKAMLNTQGYEVVMTNYTENIFSLIAGHKPSLILMDMLLSGGDGREICRGLKSDTNYSSLPIIMMSAHPQAQKECLMAGADYFLAKPFDMLDLFNTVSTALGKNSQSGKLQ